MDGRKDVVEATRVPLAEPLGESKLAGEVGIGKCCGDAPPVLPAVGDIAFRSGLSSVDVRIIGGAWLPGE